jgi:hypothetical protein
VDLPTTWRGLGWPASGLTCAAVTYAVAGIASGVDLAWPHRARAVPQAPASVPVAKPGVMMALEINAWQGLSWRR